MDSNQDRPEDSISAQPEPGRRCRDMVAVAMRAYMELLQRAAIDGKVPVDQVVRIGNAVMAAGGPLAIYYAQTEAKCDAVFALGTAERKRTDFLGRLIVQPFAHLLDDPDSGIDRPHLPQFFSAIRMVCGDEEHAQLKARCAVIAEEHRTAQGLIDWEAFYRDPDARQVLEQVQVSIARSFKRFEARKDWFMIVMNSVPQSVSLSSNAFVPKKPEDKVAVTEFTAASMCALFDALLASVRPDAFDKARRAVFVARWGSDPDKIFGRLFTELAALSRRARG